MLRSGLPATPAAPPVLAPCLPAFGACSAPAPHPSIPPPCPRLQAAAQAIAQSVGTNAQATASAAAQAIAAGGSQATAVSAPAAVLLLPTLQEELPPLLRCIGRGAAPPG